MPTENSMAVASPSSSTQSANRRPSELNAAADLVGLGSKVGDETPPPEDADGTKKSKSSKASAKKKGGSSDDGGDKAAVDKKTGGSSGESKSEEATGPITAQSIIKDQLSNNDPASAAPNGTSIQPVPALPEEDGPLKKKPKTAGGDDMIVDENGEKTSFPLLLHNVVSDAATDDCIHWLSCGSRFIISDKKKFAKDVLPRFYGPAKFTSFTRRLKRWSFARVPSGPFMGAYYNPNFRRGEPELAHRVRYNHPSPLSGAGLVVQQQKLAGMKGGNVMMPMNMNMAGMSDNDRTEMFRQMNGGMAPMMGGMNMGGMNMGGMMGYGMMMGGGPMINQNMMMMGGNGGGTGGYGKDEGNSSSGNDVSGGNGGGPAAGGEGPNPSTVAMLMEQERQRMVFQQQMGGGGSEGPNKGSNQESMNGMNNPSGGAVQGMGNLSAGGGPNMMGQGNLNAILAQYMTQGGGNRGANQGKAEEAEA